MDQQTVLFSNKSLKAMIIPLFLEQLLIMLVGMADTLVVSYAGEAAVSGVSLVNQFNTIFIYLFTALASGGAVVISQYIGRKKNDDAGESASQLLSFSAIFSILIAVMVLIGNEGMLRLMFGKVEDSVMHSCITYLRISAYSYPALAVYNAGAALFAVLENQCDHVFVGNFQYHQCYWKSHWCICFACRCCRCCIPFTDRSDIFSRDDSSTLFSEKK